MNRLEDILSVLDYALNTKRKEKKTLSRWNSYEYVTIIR